MTPVCPYLKRWAQYQPHRPNGAGQTTKLAIRLPLPAQIWLWQTLMLAAHVGFDVGKVIDAISGGAAGSWQLSNLCPRVIKGDFDRVSWCIYSRKTSSCLTGCQRRQAGASGTTLAHQYFNVVERAGCAEEGTQALIKAYEMQAGKEARST